MAGCLLMNDPAPGFSFENCRRNEAISARGFSAPRARKTGTTIVGIKFKDGIILGADTRATEGSIVSDKNCEKIHYIGNNMYCCGAGTAADTEMITRKISAQIKLLEYEMERDISPTVAVTLLKRELFRYQGHIGAALILGGVDKVGPHIYSIAPHGSTDKVPYATMGSGSLAAMAVFESGWKKDMSQLDGEKLIVKAISAGIFNDLGSGSNVDMCVVKKDEEGKVNVTYLRNHIKNINLKGKKQQSYKYAVGSTALLSSDTVHFEVIETSVRKIDDSERMDT